MENKRAGRKTEMYFAQEGSRRRPSNRKPPRGSSWQPTIPSWEKTFCKVVGSLDWATLVDMKKYVFLYENVIKWDDSAGEEAFQNAKKRFLAKMHGHPCDISLPNPDVYIDEVDWDSEIDPELLNDLEGKSVDSDKMEETEPVVIFGDSHLQNLGYSLNGWGDFEEDMKDAVDSNNNPFLGLSRGATDEKGWGELSYEAGATSMNDGGNVAAGWTSNWQNQGSSFTGWGDVNEDSKDAWNSYSNDHYNHWGQSLGHSQGTGKVEDGWGNFSDNAGTVNVDGGGFGADGRPGIWENTWSRPHPDNQKKSRNWRADISRARGTWDGKNAKSNASRRQMSSYRTSRVHGDEKNSDYARKERVISHKKAACF